MWNTRRGRGRCTTLGVVMLAGVSLCGVAQASAGQAAAARRTGARISVAPAVWSACQIPGVDGSAPGKPTWRTVDLECATVNVPRDHRQPNDATLGIPLVRKRAPGGGAKGALFINPGGPGGSGISDLADQVATEAGDATLLPYDLDSRVIAGYDLVSFDPRGVARADALLCTDKGSGDDDLFDTLPDFPVNPADERAYVDAMASITRTCVSHAGDWLSYVSTEDAARDLELLRQAVDPTRPLAYYGMSYGTYLGAVYADLFPRQVGAVALDGVVDPTLWSTNAISEAYATGAGSQHALEGFAAACAKAGDACAYAHGQSAQQISTRLRATLRKLRDREDATSRKHEYQDVVVWIQDELQEAANFPAIANTLTTVEAAVEAGKKIGELPEDPEPDDPPASRGVESPVQNVAVTCADSPLVADPPQQPGTPIDWVDYGRRADAVAENFGRSWLEEARWCESWPAPAHRYAGHFSQPTTNPLLAIGNTFDPATPLAGARHLTRLFPNAELVTLDGYGHLSTADPSARARKALGDYLLDPGTRLEPGLVCKPDHDPFSPDLANHHPHRPIHRPGR